ncbi:hypothetical protein AB6A40_009209, partial [Gnathostoma spinigerum]
LANARTLLGATMRAIIANFDTPEDLESVESFVLSRKKELAGQMPDISEGIQKLKKNIQWYQINGQNLSDWLAKWSTSHASGHRQ